MSQANTNTGAIAKHAPEPAIITLLKGPGMQQQLRNALPAHIGEKRFLRMLVTSIRANPGLATCEQTSVLSGMFELASLGLEPNTPLGHAWLIPFNRSRGGKIAQVVIGYRGYICLGHRAGVTVWAECVYEKDVFSYSLGSKPVIHHVRSEEEDPGALVKAYACVQWPDGRTVFKIVLPSDIARAQESSSAYQIGKRDKTKRDSPWYTDPASMWCKTAVRRLVAFMPMTPELARATELDRKADEGDDQGLVLPNTLNITPNAADEAARLERQMLEERQAIDQTAPETQSDDGIPPQKSEPEMTDERPAPPPKTEAPPPRRSTREAIRDARAERG